MKIMMIAGEVSGDVHGAGLIRCLGRNKDNTDFFGIGGLKMLRENFRPYYMLDTLQAHGLVEVVRHLPRLYQTLWRMRDALKEERPDVLILIDYPGFNLKLAAYAKGKGIPVIFFNSPQIWAWRKGRLKTIKRVVDKMIVLFPFEEKIYQQAGVDVSWVGHPQLDQINNKKVNKAFLKQYGLQNDLPHLAIAPGSRPSEMRRHLPTLLKSLPHIQEQVGEINCIMPVAESLDLNEVKKILESSTVPVTLIPDQFIETIQACDAAIVASGTASLQTGLALKPFAIVYQVAPLTFWIARYLADTKFIGLVNILAEKEIVPELLQNDFTAEKVAETAVRLLQDKDYRERMITELKTTRAKLGEPGAYEKAARCIENTLS
jgi:lipid-A-disaccharide synthase